MKKRLISAFVLMALVSTSLLGGCNKAPQTTDSTTKTTQTAQNEKSTKLSEKPITYTWMVPDNANFPLKNDNDIFKFFEEKTNVKMEFQPVPAANYKEKFNIVVNSNSLPDIFWPEKNNANIYGPKGLFLKLNDLIDKNAPNIKKFMTADTKKYVMAQDAGIYFIPSFNPDPAESVQYAWHYRRDILNKLNLKEPTTIDEWYTVLKKVKEAYPDMIPLTTRKDDWRFDAIAYSFYVRNNIIYNAKTDKFEYSPITDNMKSAMEYFSKLYKEGLLDKEYFTLTRKELDQRITTGKVFAFAGEWYTVGCEQLKALKKEGKEPLDLVVAVPPKTPFGEPVGMSGSKIDTQWTVAFSTKIKNPEIAIKYMDYIGFTAEGVATLEYGVKDKHWVMESYGPDYTEDYMAKYKAGNANLNSMSLGKLDKLALVQIKHFYPTDGQGRRYAVTDPIQKLEVENKLKLAKFVPKDMDLKVAVDAFMDEETAIRTKELVTTLDNVWNESRVKFISGVEPLSNWDKFVSNMKKNKCEELEKIYNDTYQKLKQVAK